MSGLFLLPTNNDKRFTGAFDTGLIIRKGAFMPQEIEETGDLLEQETTPPATDEEVEASSTSDEGIEPEGEKKETTPWFKKRIDEVTRQKYEAQRQADYWRGKAETLEKFKEPTSDAKTKPVESIADLGAKPREDEFDDYNQYLEARDTWNRNLAKFEAIAELEARQKEKEKQERETQNARQFRSWLTKGTESYEDFEEIVSRGPQEGGPPYTEAMREAVMTAENSHRIAYYLGKNPQEAAKLCDMPPAKAIYEIAKLEQKLAQTQSKKITSAPSPIKPLDVVSADTVDLYDPNLSMEDFAKRWNQERRNK